MQNNMKAGRANRLFWIAAFTAFLGFLMYCSPITLDDWAWGGSVGQERLETMFAGYNGRYLGNLLVIFLMRNKIARIVIMTAVPAIIPCLIFWFCGGKKTENYILAALLLLLMPSDMFRQIITWTSGMTNYVPPAVLTFVYLILVKEMFSERLPEYPLWRTILTALLGVAGALFMENLTLLQVVLGAFFLVWGYVKFRKIMPVHIGYLLGSCAGAAVMFSNAAYGRIASGNDGYRTMGFGFGRLLVILKTNLRGLYLYYIQNTFWLNLAIALLLCCCLYKIRTEFKKQFYYHLSIGYLLFYLGYSAMTTFYPQWRLGGAGSIAEFVLAGIFWLLQFFVPLVYFKNKAQRIKVVFPLVYSLLILAPMLAVTPIHARVLAPSYLFRICYLCVFLTELNFWKEKNKTLAMTVFAGFAAAVFLFYGVIFHGIHSAETERLAYIQTQIEEGKTEIQVPMYSEFLNGYVFRSGVPDDDTSWETRYKDFYHLPENVDLMMISYEDYQNQRRNVTE